MKAFPILVENPDKSFSCNQGMDLRDYFAKDFANTLMSGLNLTHDEEFIQSVCKQAYVWADAMMKAREQ